MGDASNAFAGLEDAATGIYGGISGETAAEQSREAGEASAAGQIQAAEIQADLQREQLAYLKEQDALTRHTDKLD